VATVAQFKFAMQALLLVAERDGPTMFAQIGMMRALQRHEPKVARLPSAEAAFSGWVE